MNDSGTGHGGLGDFTTTRRMIPIAAIAAVIGVVAAYTATLLLHLIAFFTNIFFYHRASAEPAIPAGNHLGVLVIAVPVIGSVIVGLMARYGSERIRGHGIPEALEAILFRGSRVEPRVALLKPVSAAISIGSGGPFGAEGPIIMTGGAVGSLVAQFFHLTSAERKTLLVAGAAAGMSATFGAPVASVLLAVELLLFELKPRSFVPVAIASATAAVVRQTWAGSGALFPVPPHAPFTLTAVWGAAVLGLAVGIVSALMTMSVYAAEDLFPKLRIHWMWWPAVGGLFVGIGGFMCPRALGVGYDVIGALLRDEIPLREVILLVSVKWAIWAIALGSGTSGGVLAPLLMIGCSAGAIVGAYLPHLGVAYWPLVGMGAILAGMMRAPLTAVVFALELTGDLRMLLPLLIAGSIAHAFTVLTMKRSVLTEKIARRGFHLSREYAVDPLENVFVRDVMQTGLASMPESLSQNDVATYLGEGGDQTEPIYAVTDTAGRLTGVVSRRAAREWLADGAARKTLADVATREPIVAYASESLRTAVHRMAETGRTRLPVVDFREPHRVVGLLTLSRALTARVRHLDEEQRRERALAFHPRGIRRRRTAQPT